jgi:hypothetical protein
MICVPDSCHVLSNTIDGGAAAGEARQLHLGMRDPHQFPGSRKNAVLETVSSRRAEERRAEGEEVFERFRVPHRLELAFEFQLGFQVLTVRRQLRILGLGF